MAIFQGRPEGGSLPGAVADGPLIALEASILALQTHRTKDMRKVTRRKTRRRIRFGDEQRAHAVAVRCRANSAIRA